MTTEKRYSIFISSTYVDLIQERDAVAQAILSMNHFPVGMEQWPAADEEQFEFIKKVIDESDYYLVIVGGRYGTIGDGGLSYTEREYDYAKSKDLKVIALLHKDPGELPSKHRDEDPKAGKKLEAFKKKLGTGRLTKTWSNVGELKSEAILALMYVTKTLPAVGWVRGTHVPSESMRRENLDLKERLLAHEKRQRENSPLATALRAMEDHYVVAISPNGETGFETTNATWQVIFQELGPRLFEKNNEHQIGKWLGKIAPVANKDARATTKCVREVRLKLLSLDLIRLTPVQNASLSSLQWHLTDLGKEVLFSIHDLTAEDGSRTE